MVKQIPRHPSHNSLFRLQDEIHICYLALKIAWTTHEDTSSDVHSFVSQLLINGCKQN